MRNVSQLLQIRAVNERAGIKPYAGFHGGEILRLIKFLKKVK